MEKMKKEESKIVDAYLSGYKEEVLPQSFQERVVKQAMASSKEPRIINITPAWKRLSLAASVAAFAIGIIMSNQVFTTNQSSYDSYSFENQGLYSYFVEAEQ